MKIKVAFKQNKNIWVVNAEKFILNLGLWCLTPLSTILDLQLPVQSVPITTDVVSSNILMARCT
jgi:hypothetical protein